MPQVRRYKQPQVQTQQLPGVRLSSDTPAAAFAPPKPIDLKPVIEAGREEYEREREKADQVAVIGATSALSAAETDLLHGEHGILNREGKDVFTAHDQLVEQWQKKVSEISLGLKGDRQKMAFQREVAQRWDSIDRQVQSHVASETKKYDSDQTKSLMENLQSEAVLGFRDEATVQRSITDQVKTLSEFATRHGASKEQLENMVSEAVSSTHTKVIGRMLALGDDLAASEYFKKHRDQLNGKDVANIEHDLQEGSIRGESQRQADDIMRKSTTENEAIRMAREIKDPKVRDETERRVQADWADRRRIKRETADDNFTRASQIIDRTKSLNPRAVIPPDLWNSLEPGQKSSLYNYAETVVEGGSGKATTNVDKWLDFLDLDEGELSNLTRSELETKYLRHLGKAERGRAITRWDKARNADPKEHAELKSQFTLKQLIDQSIAANDVVLTVGNNMTPDDKKLVANIEREANLLRQRVAKAKGKDLTADEEQRIVDDVVLKHVFTKRTNWQGEYRRTFYGGMKVINTDGSPRVPLSQIPERRQNEIRQRIRGRVTQDKIERAYAAFAIGDMDRFNAIMQEQ